MQKLLIYFVLIAVVFSCKKEVKLEVDEDLATEFVSFQNTPTMQTINPEANEILSAWPEFQEFQNSFNLMYRADNNEDLVLSIDDLIEKEKKLRNSVYPETFDKNQIKSRQKVLRTFLLKVKAGLADNTNVEEPLKQMLIARNAFRSQFNTVISNKLNTKLILDES